MSHNSRYVIAAPLRLAPQELAAEARELAQPKRVQAAPADAEINLCLSGGGIRAALFHLGVLYYLHIVNRLERVKRITSVSGGSILATHFALRRTQYVAKFREIEDRSQRAAAEFVEFAQTDLRGYVFRRWIATLIFLSGALLVVLSGAWRWWSDVIVPYWRYWAVGVVAIVVAAALLRRRLARLIRRRTRIRLLEQGYDRFFSRHHETTNVRLGTLPDPNVLDLAIMGTSFTAGVPISFARRGITVHGLTPLIRKNDGYPTARAVAASSAFPAAFPPVFLSKVEDLLLGAGDPAASDHYVGDGGIYDNLGISNMVSRLPAAATATPSVLIVSDAGLPFQGDAPGSEQGYGRVLRRVVRSTDVQMNRLAVLDGGDAKTKLHDSRPAVQLLPCTISEEVDGSDVEALQVKIRKIRTDLNSFGAAEIHALFRHGFNVARKICGPVLGADAEPHPRWSPLSTKQRQALSLDVEDPQVSVDKLTDKLSDSDRVPYLVGLLRWSDLRGSLQLLLSLSTWLILAFIFSFRFALPSPPGEIVNQKNETQMSFTDWRDAARYLYKQSDGALCYFEIPLQGWSRGRTVTILYQQDENNCSVIAAHVFRGKADGAVYDLPVAYKDDGHAEVTVPACNPGDVLYFFLNVVKPSEHLFDPIQVR